MTFKLFSAMRFMLVVFVCMSIAVLPAAAQKDKNFDKLMEQAENHLISDEYQEALPYLLDAYKLKPNDPNVAKKIADCYFATNHAANALPYLQAAKNGGVSDKDYNYKLGVAFHQAHRFDEAIQSLNTYKATLKHNEIEKIAEVDQIIKYCQNGKELIKNPLQVKIRNLGPTVNSKYPDYVPAVSADESILVFTSRRENTTTEKGKDNRDPQDNMYYEDIYYSVRSSDTSWSTAVHLSTDINTPSHDACVGLSPDGQEMFIYKVTGKDGGDLYMSTLIGSVWSHPEPLGANVNTPYWEPSASITPDDKILFFSSNKKGGFGGRDIYMTKLQPDGKFGPAINLGPKINTPLDEDGPFIHADGKTLYFSSKGHKSMGGFDIFSCTVNVETGEITSEPTNVGYPINTAGDDVFFVWSADNRRAYFSSAREGGYGDKDLYVLEREEAKAALVVFKGKIYNCDKQSPVAGTILVTDLGTGKAVGVYTSNSSTGRYTVILPAGKNYAITVEAPGYVFYSKNVDVPTLDHYLEIKDSICLEPIKVGTKFVLRNVFFDVNKATLRPESVTELDKLLEILTLNPTIRIRVSGHTDSDGSDQANMVLSDQRAHAVRDYLVGKGIDPKRLEWKGYGETQPVAPNDTPENKQLNRRTEIEVIE